MPPGAVGEPEAAYEALASTAVPASKVDAAGRELAVQLKAALLTSQGWRDLSTLYKALAEGLDDTISSEDFSQVVYQNEEIHSKYFSGIPPEEIAAQFLHFHVAE